MLKRKRINQSKKQSLEHIPGLYEKSYSRIIQAFMFFVYLVSSILFIIKPTLYSFAHYPSPKYLIYLGVFICIISNIIIFLSHKELGLNFKNYIQIHKSQKLVTTGMYKYSQHPIYLGFFLFHLGVLFLTHNLFLGGVMLVLFSITIIIRLKDEERFLLKAFGDEYLNYKQKTKRVFPFLY